MADQQIGNAQGWAAVSIGNGTTNKSNMNGGTGAPDAALDVDNTDNIAAMKTRLAAISGTTYTAAVLNTMTYNDMEYAIRLNDNPTTIKQ
jgi:hypothetical protein